MGIQRLDHYSIRTPRLADTQRFYEDVLQMTAGARPPFPFPGAWMYHGEIAMVHIVGYDPNDLEGLKSYLGEKAVDQEPVSSGTGTIDHVAFSITGLQATLDRLRAHNLAFRERRVPSLGLYQVFVEDPNGVTLELNFPASEAPPA